MPRHPNVIPTVKVHVALQVPLLDRLTLHLFSALENRVPHGAQSAFISERIRTYFEHRHLDLAPFVGSPAGAFVVSGPPEAITALETKLKGPV